MFELEFVDAIADVGPLAWDQVAASSYPFTRYSFLQALEDTGAVSAETGWQPRHLLVKRDGHLCAVMPGYLKSHSYGEYVFDWVWADAYQRYGRRYYPKLLFAIPFTPATGPRLCVAAGVDETEVMAALAEQLPALVPAMDASSLHILFSDAATAARWQGLGFAQRVGPQYHWFNRDYHRFDDFLARFSSRKRKNLRKERRAVAEQGLTLERLTGDQVSPELWRFFFHCYQITYAKRSGHGGYLPAGFFTALAQAMPEQLLFVLARHEGEPVAAALNFCSDDTLYGRYWGCVREFDFLHFEACYYQGIEHCIERGLARFDPGAQGEHKIQRGFEPILTYSNHWLAEPTFARAVDDFLDRESDHIAAYLDEARQLLPYKAG